MYRSCWRVPQKIRRVAIAHCIPACQPGLSALLLRRQSIRSDPLGNDIDSVIANYGYLEQPDVRGALRDLQFSRKIEIAADRWIVEVGEEDVISDKNLSLLQKLRILVFRWTLRLSTPAHKYLGLVYDAALSKQIIPVVFGPHEAKVDLPELEIEAAAKS